MNKPLVFYEVRRDRSLNRGSFNFGERKALDTVAKDYTLYVSNGSRVWLWNRWYFSQPLEDWIERYGSTAILVDKL